MHATGLINPMNHTPFQPPQIHLSNGSTATVNEPFKEHRNITGIETHHKLRVNPGLGYAAGRSINAKPAFEHSEPGVSTRYQLQSKLEWLEPQYLSM